jgi:hypothetical protein
LTFKDLQKLVQSNGSIYSNIEENLQNKPLWIFDKEQHRQEHIRIGGQCCFWHGIGCPQKDGKDMPVLPYQKTLYEALQNHKHIWILKSRGIGCSEFLLRYIAWRCVSDKMSQNSRVCFIVGPRIDLAEDLIARFKGLFAVKNTANDRISSTVAYLNGVRVEAFPSHHVDTMRGLIDVKFILSDESSYYPPFQQRDVRAVMKDTSESLTLTHRLSLFQLLKHLGQQIDLEEDSLYHKLRFDYRYGLEGPYPIYSEEQIRQARLSPEWPREYELAFAGVWGNVFSLIYRELSKDRV